MDELLCSEKTSSSLDPETETELYARLFKAYPSKTMIFITHRTAVTTLCDSVLTL